MFSNIFPLTIPAYKVDYLAPSCSYKYRDSTFRHDAWLTSCRYNIIKPSKVMDQTSSFSSWRDVLRCLLYPVCAHPTILPVSTTGRLLQTTYTKINFNFLEFYQDFAEIGIFEPSIMNFCMNVIYFRFYECLLNIASSCAVNYETGVKIKVKRLPMHKNLICFKSWLILG